MTGPQRLGLVELGVASLRVVTLVGVKGDGRTATIKKAENGLKGCKTMRYTEQLLGCVRRVDKIYIHTVGAVSNPSDGQDARLAHVKRNIGVWWPFPEGGPVTSALLVRAEAELNQGVRARVKLHKELAMSPHKYFSLAMC